MLHQLYVICCSQPSGDYLPIFVFPKYCKLPKVLTSLVRRTNLAFWAYPPPLSDRESPKRMMSWALPMAKMQAAETTKKIFMTSCWLGSNPTDRNCKVQIICWTYYIYTCSFIANMQDVRRKASPDLCKGHTHMLSKRMRDYSGWERYVENIGRAALVRVTKILSQSSILHMSAPKRKHSL